MSATKKTTVEKPKAKPGRKPKIDVESVAKVYTRDTDLLPHEWLFKISRGEPVKHTQWKIIYDDKGNEVRRDLVEVDVYADFTTRIDAAKAVAPYYASKLALRLPDTASMPKAENATSSILDTQDLIKELRARSLPISIFSQLEKEISDVKH